MPPAARTRFGWRGFTGEIGMATILLVEDRADVRDLIKDTILGVGHELECADSWREGRQRLAENAPDVLVADIRLPDGSGHDLAKRAVALGAKAVLITGHPDELQDSGEDILYLRKPFLMKTLLRAIEHHVGPPPKRPAPTVVAPVPEIVAAALPPLAPTADPILAEIAPEPLPPTLLQ
jgi:CheY-like chemotaxis protein